uniref:Haemolysin XhlA n=2 Tax=Candidatus Kentrum sp. MB TaxID=2138164 RepID=A0A451BGQ1_9GAMM|nr:MAG: hypothetical protein BECKMB1821G_GA0114241_11413 [Candidatus Kentron sp. MB]VFK77463.1 MAG: hypothetical protein BECKMB1821H_GA0114242_11433 [Candidatus Kentron sp. MB]
MWRCKGNRNPISMSARLSIDYEIQIRERIVRVEEELKNQRELMKRGFDLVEKRFEQIDKRFEQIDKRFDALIRRLDRFMRWSLGITASSVFAIIGVLKMWPLAYYGAP